MRTLILLRHAKAEPGTAGIDDFARALTARGHRAAQRIGAWLAAAGPAPGLALVSGARRALETWADVAAQLPVRVPTRPERALYLATPGEILAVLATADAAAGNGAAGDRAAERIVMVGHNPGFETLARMLAGPGSDAAAAADLARGMPTGGLALFTLDAKSWRDAAAAPARLDAFVRPRDFSDD